MIIREAHKEDAENIHFLISDVAPTCMEDFSENGIKIILAPNSVDKIIERINCKEYFSLISEIDNRVVGIMTVKDYEIIYQLFVHPTFHRKRIATRLWNEALKIINENTKASKLSVKSSTLGVQVYKKFGFKLDGRQVVTDDYKYYPMSYLLTNRIKKQIKI